MIGHGGPDNDELDPPLAHQSGRPGPHVAAFGTTG